MEVMETNEITTQKRQIVSSWLRSNGYNRVQHLEKNGVEIEADSFSRHICVHIIIEKKSLRHLISHKSSIDAEVKKVKDYATSNNREPWAAILHVNSRGEIGEEVLWIDLSK